MEGAVPAGNGNRDRVFTNDRAPALRDVDAVNVTDVDLEALDCCKRAVGFEPSATSSSGGRGVKWLPYIARIRSSRFRSKFRCSYAQDPTTAEYRSLRGANQRPPELLFLARPRRGKWVGRDWALDYREPELTVVTRLSEVSAAHRNHRGCVRINTLRRSSRTFGGVGEPLLSA